jgi:F420-dependent oxidoreductase-like protein
MGKIEKLHIGKIKFGVWLPNNLITYPPPHPFARALLSNLKELNFELVKEIAVTAEKKEFDSIWVCDHFSWHDLRVWLESWTTLSALSSVTTKIRLGTIVLCNLYRHPSLSAMMGTTLDCISKGRLEFGIGAGWNEIECKNFGIDFPEPKIRLGMLRETVEIIKKLWTEEQTTYIGKYYKIKDAYCEPKPVQKPHPPILIGGGGEKKTLKIVARFADESNFSGPLETVKNKLDLLKNYCLKIDRDFDSIAKTTNGYVVIAPTRKEYLFEMKKRYDAMGSPGSFNNWIKNAEIFYIAGTPDECFQKIKRYVDVGVSSFILKFGLVPKTYDMELFAKEVIPRINELTFS